MPVSVEKLIRMRQMDLGHLPAVCISDHFIVAMEKWAPWWPSIAEVGPPLLTLGLTMVV